MRRMTSCLVLMFAILLFATSGLATEKVKFATAVKASPSVYLPVLAAQEKGFWRERGLEVEWVSFRSGGATMRALVAGDINVGFANAPTAIRAAIRGVPVVIVADLHRIEWGFWVRADSRLRRPEDLKGAKIGVFRLGGSGDALGRFVVKRLGLEKEVTIVATGGYSASTALLKSGAVDVLILSPEIMINLKVKGMVRELLSVNHLLPKEWVDNTIFASQKFIKERPGTVKEILRAVLNSISYLRQDPAWAKEKMKAMSGYSDAVADSIYNLSMALFTRDGRISNQALENVKKFMIDFGILPKEKAPAIEDIFTSQFIDKS